MAESYNLFIRDEIARIMKNNPKMEHKEAFVLANRQAFQRHIRSSSASAAQVLD